MKTIKALYNDIETAIKTNVNAIKWLDWNMQQLDVDAEAPVSWPCVLVDVPDIGYSNTGELTQIGQPQIVLTVAFKRLERSHFKRDTSVANIAFAHLEILEDINTALHGLGTARHSPFVRTGTRKTTKANHYEYSVTYTCATIEVEPKRKYTPTMLPGPTIELQ